MGTYIPERYQAAVKFIKAYEPQYRINSSIYIPFTSYIKEKLKLTNLDHSIITFDHMPRNIYLSQLASTKVMIDVSNKNQTGLAMRVIEALSMGKKVLTSNHYITCEAFYNPNNICIYDPNNPIIPKSFIDQPFDGVAHTLSLWEWLEAIFR